MGGRNIKVFGLVHQHEIMSFYIGNGSKVTDVMLTRRIRNAMTTLCPQYDVVDVVLNGKEVEGDENPILSDQDVILFMPYNSKEMR